MKKSLLLIFIITVFLLFSVGVNASNLDFEDIPLLTDDEFLLGSSNNENFNPFFEDVAGDSWYFDAVAYLHDRGAIQGTSSTEFSPNREVTRAEFIKLLGAVSGVNESATEYDFVFDDVSEDSWYAPYVQWGVDNNIIMGYSIDTFSPDMTLTREEAATMIYRLGNNIVHEEWDSMVPYSEVYDSGNISSWAKDAVNALLKNDIVCVYETGNFEPDRSVTRAEAA